MSVAPAPVPYAMRPRLFMRRQRARQSLPSPWPAAWCSSSSLPRCSLARQPCGGGRVRRGGDIMDVFTTYDAVNQLEFLPESRKRSWQRLRCWRLVNQRR